MKQLMCWFLQFLLYTRWQFCLYLKLPAHAVRERPSLFSLCAGSLYGWFRPCGLPGTCVSNLEADIYFFVLLLALWESVAAGLWAVWIMSEATGIKFMWQARRRKDEVWGEVRKLTSAFITQVTACLWTKAKILGVPTPVQLNKQDTCLLGFLHISSTAVKWKISLYFFTQVIFLILHS